MKTIDLDALENESHTVTKAGVRYRVRPVTARIANAVAAARDEPDGIAKMRRYYDVVALLVPGMTRDDVEDLSMAQLAAIVALSSTQADAVEDAAGNGALPNAVGSAPETPSPTPSEPVAATSATM